jgi:transcriptional regulator with XRE-family HTH domain
MKTRSPLPYIGRNLSEFRLNRKLSRVDIASHMDLHRASVGRVELGKACLTIEDVVRLADGTNQDPVRLFATLIKKDRSSCGF